MSAEDSVFHLQSQFLQASGLSKYNLGAESLARKLVAEEAQELAESGWLIQEEPDYNAAKEACDLIYVVAQYLNVTIGADAALDLYKAVHANNMSKCVNGKLVKRADGKVLKPEGYKSFDIKEWAKGVYSYE